MRRKGFSLSHLKSELEELLGSPVDIIRLRDRMNKLLRRRIEREGNLIVHHYFDIDVSVILYSFQNEVPDLYFTICVMLNDLSQ